MKKGIVAFVFIISCFSLFGLAPAPQVKTVYDYAYDYCVELNVPYCLVLDIGQNESMWSNPSDLRYVHPCWVAGEDSRGDLQINMKYWDYFCEQYGSRKPTRLNLLWMGIRHLKELREKHGSWIKARFVYGRGHWRPYNTWTKAERKFMDLPWKTYGA